MSGNGEKVREPQKMVCPVCGGTGKRFVYRSEIVRHYCGPCQPCYGTGRVEIAALSASREER